MSRTLDEAELLLLRDRRLAPGTRFDAGLPRCGEARCPRHATRLVRIRGSRGVDWSASCTPHARYYARRPELFLVAALPMRDWAR